MNSSKSFADSAEKLLKENPHFDQTSASEFIASLLITNARLEKELAQAKKNVAEEKRKVSELDKTLNNLLKSHTRTNSD